LHLRTLCFQPAGNNYLSDKRNWTSKCLLHLCILLWLFYGSNCV
jgi:hypothetical protein